MLRKPASTPQKQPAANVARSAPAGPWPSKGAAGAGWLSLVFLSFSTSSPFRLLAGRGRLASRGHLEGQRGRVDAVAVPGRARAVTKDVAQVPATAAAADLGAAHEHAVVRTQLDRVVGSGLEEARPAGTGVELGVRLEQLVPAACALVGAVLLVPEQRAGERHLGVAVAQHVVLLAEHRYLPFLLAPVRCTTTIQSNRCPSAGAALWCWSGGAVRYGR